MCRVGPCVCALTPARVRDSRCFSELPVLVSLPFPHGALSPTVEGGGGGGLPSIGCRHTQLQKRKAHPQPVTTTSDDSCCFRFYSLKTGVCLDDSEWSWCNPSTSGSTSGAAGQEERVTIALESNTLTATASRSEERTLLPYSPPRGVLSRARQRVHDFRCSLTGVTSAALLARPLPHSPTSRPTSSLPHRVPSRVLSRFLVFGTPPAPTDRKSVV